MIDSMKFRKLENGYTVKYHVPITAEMATKGPSGFGGELFVTDKENLKVAVAALIEKWLERDPEPRKETS
jgi:hypothetical protein